MANDESVTKFYYDESNPGHRRAKEEGGERKKRINHADPEHFIKYLVFNRIS